MGEKNIAHGQESVLRLNRIYTALYTGSVCETVQQIITAFSGRVIN